MALAAGAAVLLLGACGEAANPLGELQQRAVASAGAVTAKVTYTASAPTNGQVSESTLTVVQRPPDSRVDISGEVNGQPFGGTMIIAGGKSYLCIPLAGEESQCFSTPTDQNPEENPLDVWLQPTFGLRDAIAQGSQEFEAVDTSKRMIAGVEGECFAVRPAQPTELEQAELCFSEEGILLALRTTSPDGVSSVEATQVTTEVTDADFELPFPVSELP